MESAQWSDARLSEPQLPIYCLGLGPEAVGAVLFAAVRNRRRERGFRGLAATDGLWPSQEKALQALLGERGWTDFSDLCAYWRTTLTALGDDFRQRGGGRRPGRSAADLPLLRPGAALPHSRVRAGRPTTGRVAMATEAVSFPADLAARRQALAVDASFIVQAPAGSGKTELLIQRILTLMATVNAPEEILAITFTRKAAAEMRRRLLDALERAADDTPPEETHAVETWRRARLALARDRDRGWELCASPARLQVLTIDGFCAALVRRMPYLSRFGEMPAIAEEPADLYRDAAARLCARLEGSGAESAALRVLLGHLDNRLTLLRDLLVAMLGRRDQWLRHLRTDGTTARAALEGALGGYVRQALADADAALGAGRLNELLRIGRRAAANLADTAAEVNPLAALLDDVGPPGTEAAELPVWQALVQLLLTDQDRLRSPRGLNARLGFPPGPAAPNAELKGRMAVLLDDLESDPACVERLQVLRRLPAQVYAEPQWAVLAALIELLPLAVQELRTVFRQRGAIDFAEISRGALTALGDELAPSELLLQLDGRLRHILVDEFQDTSRAQYDLLAILTAGWERGDGRTLFLVGDPMQSIYRFREAEVGLYLRARAFGLGDIHLTPLTLSANFRSQSPLVDWFNATFQKVFPAAEDPVRGAVPFSPAVAARPSLDRPAVTVACFAPRDDRAEAARVVALIQQARAAQPGAAWPCWCGRAPTCLQSSRRSRPPACASWLRRSIR